MAVRALPARLLCDRRTLGDLWRTHRAFNERLPAVLSILFRMRRGESGATPELRDLYRRIGWFITSCPSQNAPYLLNGVSIRGWQPATAEKLKANVPGPEGEPVEVTGASWAGEAALLSAQGQLLFDKHELLGDLPDSLRQVVVRECAAIISGHDELTRIWHCEHADWLRAKAAWEADEGHRLYLAVRPLFEAFEAEVGGKATKRRGRWHLYLGWLRAHPDLAAWRGGPALVHELDEQARRRIARARPWKKRSVEAEEFWKVNPELGALDRLHGEYESRFVRRRKTKRNPDGFDHRPTFTLPHPVRHPRWFVFNAPQTSPAGYRNLRLPAEPGECGSIELRLLTGDVVDGEYPKSWVRLEFRGDPRLSDFTRVIVQRPVTKGKDKGQMRDREAYEFWDRHFRMRREAQISGAKLLFRDVRLHPDGSLQDASAYLIFTCTVEDLPLTENARLIQWSETGEVTRSGKKRKAKTLPPGLVTCAVDLGCRNLGFATLAVGEEGRPRVLRARNLWVGDEETGGGRSAGPDLAHIGRHKRDLRRRRRLRGKPVKGERSHVELQGHIDHMAEDRFKKGARAIINFALNTDAAVDKKTGAPYPRADVLLLENLENLVPDAERERGINRALLQFNRGHLVQRVKEMAADVGLRVFEVSPVGTSQVCSGCGALGRRYSVRRDPEAGKPVIHFGEVEKLFACPECAYRANADHNASVNLHRRFYADEAVRAYTEFRALSPERRRERVREVEERLLRPQGERPSLAVMHLVEASPQQTPF
jgi:Putative transposase DNA-binding domain